MNAAGSSTNKRFITSEMWAGPSATESWVEVGHTAGWFAPENSNGYHVFMAIMLANGTYAERSFGSVTQNGAVTDEFQISRAPTTNEWRVHFNGTYKTTRDMGWWTTPRLDFGGEVATPYGTSSTFNMRVQALSSTGARSNLGTELTRLDDPPLSGSRPADSYWNWRIRP